MRLIDADALIEAHYQHCNEHHGDTDIFYGWSLELMRNAPTIDAVPVVRCKDCRWYVRSMIKQDGTLDKRYKPDWCDLYRRVREEMCFCADGERKDNDTDLDEPLMEHEVFFGKEQI